jgi:F-type H+-transporting ATPase subunit gamma
MVGAKGVQFFRSVDVNILGATTSLGEDPQVKDLVGAIKVMLDEYSDEKIDRLFLVHNNFINTMSQTPSIKTLLPVEAIDTENLQDNWDYIYEPDSRELLEYVLERYIESQVYRAVVENVACEMAAKMVAMKSATDNAGKIIEQLELDYNKARQASITQEISEIVGGAAAV